MKKIQFKKVAALCVVLFVAQANFAQSWNTMAKWVQNCGWKNVARMSHPNDSIVSHSLSYDDENIYLTVTFKDTIPFAPKYTCWYEIRKGVKSGITYFRTIAEPGDFHSSFNYFMQNMVSEQTMRNFKNEGMGALYGAEEWYDLSLGKKAAAMLLSDFLEYYDE